jgi:hypothetical protein
MLCLKLNYEIIEYKGLLCIFDIFKEKTVYALNVESHRINGIRKNLCNGTSDTNADSVYKHLLLKKREYFDDYTNIEYLDYFRTYNIINRDSFFGVELFKDLIMKQEIYLQQNKKFRVKVDSKLGLDLPLNIPFIDYVDDATEKIDMFISNVNSITKVVSHYTLTISVLVSEIYIGPVHHKANSICYEIEDNQEEPNKLMNYEQRLIFFFVERIAIVLFLDVLDKMHNNQIIPSRFRLKYDRMSSEITASDYGLELVCI